MMRIVVTGGAGFIGSAVIRHLITQTDAEVLNLDKLTYAGNLESLASVSDSPRYRFVQLDLCAREPLEEAIAEFSPTHVMHLAAESHVDRSIDGPGDFIQTNIVGTYILLEVIRAYWAGLSPEAQCPGTFQSKLKLVTIMLWLEILKRPWVTFEGYIMSFATMTILLNQFHFVSMNLEMMHL